ncbi:SCO4402 family protein [Sphingopyxis sp.]|uniref:SCO4402 family protein n=1 Tax=Sphingopyxis sp. TaxID=1908224 RepID=UPI003D0D1D10
MTDDHSFLPASLANPEKREELILYLQELAAEDPEELWHNEREQGLMPSIDQIFHFFFDDNDFDERAIGESLLDTEEAKTIDEVKALLDAMLVDLPKGEDAAFVSHHLWPRLRTRAQAAQSAFEART